MSETKSSPVIKPEQIIEIILKRHWLIIIPFCISMLIGSYLVVKLPRKYQARTVILVQPQKVPSSIVQDIVSSDLNARISTLSQQILSRTSLEKIINDLNLFSGPEYEKMFMEQKVASLQKRISVNVKKGRSKTADSFTIAFKGTDPQKVMKITTILASSFINENLKIREMHALGTNMFLEDELESMRQRLVENEKKLKDYRWKYMGGLPEQLDSNLRILESLNEQLTSVQSEIRDAKIRIDELKRIEIDLGNSAGVDFDSEQRPSNLAQLKDQLETYQNRYTEKHPDVIRLKKTIADLEQQLVTDEDETPKDASKKNANLNPAYLRQLRGLKAELKQLESERKEISKQISVYKKRVEDTPNREQELMSLQRDYNNINETYSSLLGRQLEAQIAVNMEKKQKGEQFRILDPARLPQSPVEPDMRKLFLFVVAAGLGFGGGIIFLLEFFDSSFKAPEDVESFLGLPVVATIPTVFQKKEVRRQRLKLAGGILGVVLSIGCLGVFLGSIILMG